MRRLRRLLGRALLTLLAAASALSFNVTEALGTHIQCGDTIAHNETLDNDLVDCPGIGIIIGAANITLDLNAHTIDGTGSGATYDPYNTPIRQFGIDNSAGHDGVEIKDGNIRDFGLGVELFGASRNHIHDLSLSNNGFGIGIHTEGVRDSWIHEDAHHNLIEKNSISVGTAGIRIDGYGYGDARQNTISKNTLDSGPRAIDLYGGGENSIQKNTGYGAIWSDESSGNRIEKNSLPSVHLSLARNNLIRQNTVKDITLAGSSRNQIVQNQVSGTGIAIDSLFRGQGSYENLVTDNVVTGGYGISLAGPSGYSWLPNAYPGAVDTLVVRNFVSGSKYDGIYSGAPTTTFAHNTANDNDDFGIEAVEGVIDGGGNKAAGNGNPLQCLNVICK